MKYTGYIDNRDTIGIGVTMYVTYISWNNDTHAMFVLVADLTAVVLTESL